MKVSGYGIYSFVRVRQRARYGVTMLALPTYVRTSSLKATVGSESSNPCSSKNFTNEHR